MNETFKIMHGKHITSIPWAMIAPHGARAVQNHSQSLLTLHGRGGLSPGEAMAVLLDLHWYDYLSTKRDPEAELQALVKEFDSRAAGEE